MKRNKIRAVIIHISDEALLALPQRIGHFHVDVVERRVKESGLPPALQMAVVARILDELKRATDK